MNNQEMLGQAYARKQNLEKLLLNLVENSESDIAKAVAASRLHEYWSERTEVHLATAVRNTSLEQARAEIEVTTAEPKTNPDDIDTPTVDDGQLAVDTNGKPPTQVREENSGN